MIFTKTPFKLILTLTFSIAIFSSCVNPKTETSNSDTFSTEEALINSGEQIVEATFKPLDIPKEENDGRLSLKINFHNSDKDCYFPGEQIPIIVEYQNLTSTTFQIADYDVVAINPLIGAKAQIYPRVYENDGQEIFTPEHLTFSQYGYLKETKGHSLEPYETFEVLVETYFFPPKIIATSTAGERQNITPPSGTYLIQFGYVNVSNPEYWEGAISSNAIEVCIE